MELGTAALTLFRGCRHRQMSWPMRYDSNIPIESVPTAASSDCSTRSLFATAGRTAMTCPNSSLETGPAA